MSVTASLYAIVFSLSISLALFSMLVKSNWFNSVALVLLGCCCTALGVSSWLNASAWVLPVSIGPYAVEIVSDRLSALFLVLLGTVTFCCALFSTAYVSHIEGKVNLKFYWPFVFLFVGSMAIVLCAGNAVCFLVAWEVMSLSSAGLVVSEFRQHRAQRAAMIYLVATRIATAFLCLGFLIMFSQTSSFAFSAWRFDEATTWGAAAFILLGLCIKAGLWPCHIWLPHAHPEAPTPVSALMSGVMVKVAIYAAIRFFIVGGLSCQPLIYALFVLATISAFWGVLFAINQNELKRLLAYSTVENIGLILLGLSLALFARNANLPQVSQLALTFVLLHCFAHGLFKSLLFLCSGSVDYSTHTRELSHLGGLAKSMPVTAGAFVLGSAAICALPPLNGFVSKWFLYQALFASTLTLKSICDRSLCLAAVCVLGCVGALAVACFAKAAGVGFLGKSRTTAVADACEAPQPMVAAQVLLGVACVVMGLLSPQVVSIVTPLVTQVPSNLPLSMVTALPLLPIGMGVFAITGIIYLLVLCEPPRRYRTWDCGFGGATPRAQVASASFAQPITTIFAMILGHKLSIVITGRDRRHFPERIQVEPSLVSLLEARVYEPAGRFIGQLSRLLARLQAGSIHLYLVYVCISLVVFVLLGTQLW